MIVISSPNTRKVINVMINCVIQASDKILKNSKDEDCSRRNKIKNGMEHFVNSRIGKKLKLYYCSY